MAGKGDKPRPVDKNKYDDNFDRIFVRKLTKSIRRRLDIQTEGKNIEIIEGTNE